MKKFCLLLVVCLFLSTLGLAQPAEDFSRVYKVASGVELSLHVFHNYRWKEGDQRLGIVFFNGGGWLNET